MKPALVKPGHFLATVARHIRFIIGFTADESSEIRFITPDGGEWHPVSTYVVDGIVCVDLQEVEYKS